MQTKQLYLDDSYLETMEAEILSVVPEDNSYRLVLDKTVFYPMGGGQATDQGMLYLDNVKVEVYQVIYKDGEIWHYVKSDREPKVGDKITGVINWERRYKNMKLHSAGHIVDFAVFLLGYSPKKLVPMRADHNKNPHIVYQGVLGKDFKKELEDKVSILVAKNLELSWYFEAFEDLEKEAIYLQPGLPTNKPLRTLKLEGVGAVADGGTQVKKTGEVGTIKITSIEEKDGNTIISYSVG